MSKIPRAKRLFAYKGDFVLVTLTRTGLPRLIDQDGYDRLNGSNIYARDTKRFEREPLRWDVLRKGHYWFLPDDDAEIATLDLYNRDGVFIDRSKPRR